MPTEWQVEKFEKDYNKRCDDYMAGLERYAEEQRKTGVAAAGAQLRLTTSAPPPPPPLAGGHALEDDLPCIKEKPLESLRR